MLNKRKTTKKVASKPQSNKKLKLFHFYRYNKKEGGKTKKARHPKLIVGRSGKKYIHMGLTSSRKSGHHANIKIKDPTDWSKTSYIRKEKRIDDVSSFGSCLSNYNLHPDDKSEINKFLAKKK